MEIKASAAGSAKYNITAYTFKYDGLNKLTWQTATEGIADIIPGQEITAGNAKVTFTVDGATTKNSSEAITAKLKGSSAESPEISIDSEKITTVRGTKTITVDLSGNTLSADTYTLTLSVPADRLERDIERYITETNTTAVTFEVTTKEVTLGTPTPTSTTFTSGTALPVGGYTITFPVTGIASLSSDEGKKPTATITPAAEGAATVDGITATVTAESVEGSVSNVVVTLTGTPIATEDTEYTLTLTIPAAGITVKTGYADSTAALTQTFTFKVTTTTPITATSGRENTLVATQGETLPDNTKLTVEVTGASDMTINGIQVIAFQGDAEAAFTIDTEKTTFTSPTGDNKTGTLTITLKGTAPILSTTATGATRENGLKVVIPQAAFTPMDGYTVPTGGITVNDFKAVLNPATSAGA